MPFQLPCVWSLMACEFSPMSKIVLLSTRIVSVCLPAVNCPKSYWCGVASESFVPMKRPFKRQDDAFAAPAFGNFKIALIPRNAFVVFVWLKPERNFHARRLAVLC